ncbi:hypothetical protein CPHO_08525 [Corynebacterium phocae]|uniref:Uncharacterized protein n=1 Tax=Corynebacterium phocae TaxID=161895 RepID=A0A1L7D4J0_9CORY|nr:hypothetical protein [Corynebacterium phocae]APT92923.1 hypothetical protein CPHO_08525 [Corynebacterium phocae]KAA8723253.1 hypothetical protein F4V58_08025 [Corynebacterium phocae]
MAFIVLSHRRAESHDTRISAWKVINSGVEYHVTQASYRAKEVGSHNTEPRMVRKSDGGQLAPGDPIYNEILTNLHRKKAA